MVSDWEKFGLELLERRRNSLNKGREDYHIERKERGIIRKNNILEIIVSYTIHNDGILVKDLAKLVKLSDRFITHYIQELKEEEKIKTSEKNGKLVSTSEVFKYPLINTEIFGYYFKTRFLNKNISSKKNFILTDVSNTTFYNRKTKKIYNPQTNDYDEFPETLNFSREDFINYKKQLFFTSNFVEKDNLEKMLFEFSNRIGSFITYLIIYAMNSDNYNNSNNSELLSDKTNDEISKEVIKKGILSILPFLLESFKDMYDKRTGKYPYFKDIETKKEYFRKLPKYIIQENESILSLLDAFKKLYPLMSYEFEKIMPEQNRYLFKDFLSEEPSGIEGYKKYMKDLYELLRKQETCKHEYEEKSETDYKQIIVQCKLCNHKTKLNISKKNLKDQYESRNKI